MVEGIGFGNVGDVEVDVADFGFFGKTGPFSRLVFDSGEDFVGGEGAVGAEHFLGGFGPLVFGEVPGEFDAVAFCVW